MEEMLRFITRTGMDDRRLPAHHTELGFLPVERFSQVEIPVSDFQETEVFQLHWTRCTEREGVRNGGLETIGYGSRLAGRRVMGICEEGWWRDY